MPPPDNPFFTIGHSTRSLPDLLELLQASEVRLLVDVRTVPRSRTNPQFNRDAMPGSLAPFWENDSFRNYADYALTEPFREGLERVLALGGEQRCAIMCSEAVWWRCHRRIIADYLLNAGKTVCHIMGPGKVEAAILTPAAHATPEGGLVYS